MRFSTTKMNSAIVAYTHAMSRPEREQRRHPERCRWCRPSRRTRRSAPPPSRCPRSGRRPASAGRASAPPAGPRRPSEASATPNRIEKKTTCRISPWAKAPTTLEGTMWVTKSTNRSSFALGGERRDVGRGRESRGMSMPSARPQHVHHHQADRQREGRHHLEVDQRLEPHPADPLEVARVRHAADDGEEDDRRDDHPHQVDEGVAHGLHRPARRPARARRPGRRARWPRARGRSGCRRGGSAGRGHEVRRS